MTADNVLREGRLVFYRGLVERIDRILHEFLRRSGARSALLVDKNGHLVTRAGEDSSFDADTVSALVAGSFAATKEMAKLLGEREFSALFHQGERDNIQLAMIDDRAILTVLFDDSTTLGMVRLYVTEATRRLTDVLRGGGDGEGADDDGPEISERYGDEAQSTLDELFAGDDEPPPAG